MRAAIAIALLFAAHEAFAQQPVHNPEKCLAAGGDPAVTATHDGKVYAFRNAACRDEFLTDPERFAQLYDALIELRAAGVTAGPARDESLVPS